MKIAHFESGLGNQMLNYAEFLAVSYSYPNDVFMEKLIYETLPKNKGICQWNGFELYRVFGIHLPDIESKIGHDNYEQLKKALIYSAYWNNSWKYAEPIVEWFNKHGYHVLNLCKRGTDGDKEVYSLFQKMVKYIFFNTRCGNYIYRKLARTFEKQLVHKNYENMFILNEKDFYFGQSLKFMYKNENIELIEKQLRNDFQFKNIDKRNASLGKMMEQQESVSIHVRRGDFLSRSNFCYKYGYFKRAVKLIKKKIDNPVFYFFFDSNDTKWIEEHLALFGITKDDKYCVINFNKGENSYLDMYLMTCCHHNIITQSSFGWWGSWLNRHEDKITISPDCRINTKYWC